MTSTQQAANINLSDNEQTLMLSGAWTAYEIPGVKAQFNRLHIANKKTLIIDGTNITDMDTAGTWVLLDCILTLEKKGIKVTLTHFNETHLQLFSLVRNEQDKILQAPPEEKPFNYFYTIGFKAVEKVRQLICFFSFIGELTLAFIGYIQKPKHIQWKAIFKTIQTTGIDALPIVGLLSFLIGVVLAYQLGIQLKLYGANIYIVDLTGMAILREFGPLITAIILAGRTSSSFTALIGTMKVNEEIDALKSMGLSPMQRLVLPKIIGLMIAFPLLVIWADLFGVLGSMFMAKGMLGINFPDFILRFHSEINPVDFLAGMSRSPVFALIIAGIGCFRGLQVAASAESVGKETTKSVVQAIFLIIVADAIFSIVYSYLGI